MFFLKHANLIVVDSLLRDFLPPGDLRDYPSIIISEFFFLNAAREAFIEELKCKLENNHQEIDSIKQELATSNNKISELEEKRKMYEKNIQNLSEKG